MLSTHGSAAASAKRTEIRRAAHPFRVARYGVSNQGRYSRKLKRFLALKTSKDVFSRAHFGPHLENHNIFNEFRPAPLPKCDCPSRNQAAPNRRQLTPSGGARTTDPLQVLQNTCDCEHVLLNTRKNAGISVVHRYRFSNRLFFHLLF